MSQASKLLLGFVLSLAAITAAHGCLNLGWLVSTKRASMVIGHLPVT